MRGTIEGLSTPHPLGTLLPAALQEDRVAMQLVRGLDEVLAPIVATLDCLHCYVDPQLAPVDFLAWLAEWVDAALDENWTEDQQRASVAMAVELHRWRGTVGGLRRHLEILTGGSVEVDDSGGVTWSTAPTVETVERRPPHVLVRINLSIHPDVAQAVEATVRVAKPAHVVHDIAVG